MTLSKAFLLLCLSGFLLTGCSGGGGTQPPPAPAFSLSVTPSAITLSPGGTPQQLQVSVNPQNGFNGTVSVSLPTLPNGVNGSPSTLSLTSSSAGVFSLSAAANAAAFSQTVSLNGSSGALTASVNFKVAVQVPARPDPFHLVGGALVHGFYDESRALLYAANYGLNEIDVISGTDASIKARIPAPQPWSIDQMPDGKTLVIGTQTQQILTMDQDTFAVTSHPYSLPGAYFGLFFPNVVTMANGKVLVIGLEQGIDSDNIYDAGQYLVEWDSSSNTFAQLEPTTSNNIGFAVDSIARSGDHKWAIFSADQFYLYSSDSDSLTSAALTAVNPPVNEFGVRGYAVNSDGSEIAVASASQLTFLNQSLAVIGSTPLPGAFQTARTAVQFSFDDSKVFLQYPFPLTIEEVDAKGFKTLGSVSGDASGDDNLEQLLATSSTGNAYVGIDGGLRLVDLSATPVPDGTAAPAQPPSCPNFEVDLPLNTSKQVQLSSGVSAGVNVFIGGQPATVSSDGLSLAVPASATVGPADEECVDSAGNTEVIIGPVSYGVLPLDVSATLLPTSGTPSIYAFGYGMGATLSEIPSVTIADQAAQQVSSLGQLSLGAVQGISLQVPQGSAGESGSLTVMSSLGTGTLAYPLTYVQSTVVPTSGVLQLTFDPHRQVLYVLKSTEVDVLDAVALKWKSPLALPVISGGYASMALSPDGTALAVLSLTGGCQVAIVDPDSGSSSLQIHSGASNLNGAIAITSKNVAVLPGLSGLALDLGTHLFSSFPFSGEIIRASADGTHLYSAALNVSSGAVTSIDPVTYATATQNFGYMFWTDLAVSPDGSHFAAVDAPPYEAGDVVGFFDSGRHFLNTNVYPTLSAPDATGVLGAVYSPQSEVLVVALGDSIELWDATQGTLRARLMAPEKLQTYSYPEGAALPVVALDAAGKTIFAASASGITAFSLPSSLDTIPATSWSPHLSFGVSGARALHAASWSAAK